MFFKKRKEKHHDHEYLEKEISDQRIEINEIKLELEKIKSHIISLRGFVNRKMAGEIPGETSKNTDGLDELRRG